MHGQIIVLPWERDKPRLDNKEKKKKKEPKEKKKAMNGSFLAADHQYQLRHH